MTNYIDLAQKWSAAGYSVIPVTAEKLPAIKDWAQFQTRPMTAEECEKHFKKCWGIALLAGGVKGITILDFDMKYSLSFDLFDRFKNSVPAAILKKMYYQTTKNKGAHFIFSCDKVEPNQKLANRYTTADEKHEVYMNAYSSPKTRDKALKIASNHRSLVLMETRGGTNEVCGGYAVISPSPGYEHKFGKIQKISIEEYDVLMESARSFNEVIEERKDIRLDKYKEWTLSPFSDFNETGDVLGVLLDNGWEEVSQSGKSIRLKRAGSTHSKSSALLDTESRIFNCFSTSTSFDVGRGYSPSDVFIHLECEDDVSLAFRRLVELGYGKE